MGVCRLWVYARPTRERSGRGSEGSSECLDSTPTLQSERSTLAQWPSNMETGSNRSRTQTTSAAVEIVRSVVRPSLLTIEGEAFRPAACIAPARSQARRMNALGNRAFNPLDTKQVRNHEYQRALSDLGIRIPAASAPTCISTRFPLNSNWKSRPTRVRLRLPALKIGTNPRLRLSESHRSEAGPRFPR